MALNLNDDLVAMLSVDDFGVSATHINEFGVATTLEGIFDNSYSAVDSGMGSVTFADSNPTFTGRTVDFTEIKYGDKLEIGTVTWIIREIMPDGTGVTELTLEKE
jgi:hypothetical protein